jgi:hypothetical protein
LDHLAQVEDELCPAPGQRRKSNEFYRKLGMDDRILLFMMRMRRNMPFEGLRILFGISFGTASNYYDEMLDIFHKNLVPWLLDPRSSSKINENMPDEFKADLPGAKFVVDLTSFRYKSKENFILSRILHLAYHHQTKGITVFGTTQPYPRRVLVLMF